MSIYTVTVRTVEGTDATYATIAASSCDAFFAAVDAQGDTPCGITVMPAAQ